MLFRGRLWNEIANYTNFVLEGFKIAEQNSSEAFNVNDAKPTKQNRNMKGRLIRPESPKINKIVDFNPVRVTF